MHCACSTVNLSFFNASSPQQKLLKISENTYINTFMCVYENIFSTFFSRHKTYNTDDTDDTEEYRNVGM